MDIHEDARFSRCAVLFAPLFAGLFLWAACDTASDAKKKTGQLQLNAQSTTSAVGDSTVVEGDTIVFRRVTPGEAPQDPQPVAANSADGTLHINGFFLAFTGSSHLEGTINRNDGTITVRIQVDANEDFQFRMPGPFFYEAQVTDLPAGTYQLRVTHEGDVLQDPQKNPTTVLAKTVTVK